jgi:hypothetical protein
MIKSLLSPIASLVGTYNVIQNDANWESKMAEASASSWKDEYLVILLTSPVVAIMYGAMTDSPEIIDRVKHGLETLELLPDWLSYLLYVAVTASFGVKGADKIMKMRGK